jgi:hypothetical protein
VFAPGQVPAYSNYGATLAGYIVERVSGKAYDDYVEQRIFAPLGMRRSTTRQALPASFKADMSRGYLRGSGPAKPFERFAVVPAGGATATAADLAPFMIAWLAGGEAGGARILAPETVRRTLDTRLPVVPPLNAMLLGFYEQNLNGRRIVGHRGDTQYFHSALSLLPDDGVGVYVVVNSTGREGAAGTLLTEFITAFADRYFPAPGPIGAVSADEAAAHARQMTGTWMASRGQSSNFFSLLGFLSQVTVTVDESGGLVVPGLMDATGEPMRWREVSPFVWHQVGGKERLAARLEGGRVAMWSIDSVSPFLVMLPAPWWMSLALFGPLLAIALVVLAASLVSWPVVGLLRRHYRLWPARAGPDGRPYRLARVAAAGALAAIAGWGVLIGQVEGNLFAFASAADPGILALKAATSIFCVGGMAAASWDVKRNWASRGRSGRAASIVLALAFATLAWLAATLELAGFSTDY